jgi:RsiW-degrading membrane proteinase PrsW (M82 family)
MNNTSRVISTAWIAAAVTFVLTVVIGLLVAYAWLHGDSDPSWFDSRVWMFIFGGPILVPLLFIPALVVGIVVGIFYKIRLSKIRLSRDL